MYVLALVALILCILFKILNVNNSPTKSLFYSANATFLEEILKHTPAITEPGHIQTIIQGVLSRMSCPLVNGQRYFFITPDHATVTYDLYQPLEKHTLSADFTLAICPGIANTSESVYIRRAVLQAQVQGYRVAVLNHVGALKNVPVTSPRIFSYGYTHDYDGMIQDIVKRFPGTKLICVGFSMGGNLVTKYLGEKRTRPDCIVAGISACQGYDAVEAGKYLLLWENCRRLYLYAMTENLRLLLRNWQKVLLSEDFKREKGIQARDIWSAATLVELDEAYGRKVAGFSNVDDFYRDSSSLNYIDGLKVPMVFINAEDDPIVPRPLLNHMMEKIKNNDKILYIEQKYGGHLGFYEGGYIYPNAVTWLDRLVVNLSDSLAMFVDNEKVKLSLDEDSALLAQIYDGERSPSEDSGSSTSSSPLILKRTPKGSKPSLVCKSNKMHMGLNFARKCQPTAVSQASAI
eukprot:maker-scaffold1518_size37722-snap-gene-0.14 protein:Tk01679 transcript:maker-scaffold1518_size37722-snap-gene-0.14-mRNA-1 annotation:"unknown"